ncbi:hypothetical protein SPI_06483 [Niveomyces insectorum RCEF 264]|uniref:Uncharacterized protein n=1 Tax=Niveomyces insectorum RCEF 264 TaxID=1081102 RepID=A0A167RAD1_9HYPO|nr:hypothetical protein SPI_06483 [Niveomyces insectorum RCEF 264]
MATASSASFLAALSSSSNNSSSNNNISSNTNRARTPKSPRSRFSKALPAPPPVLDKLLPSFPSFSLSSTSSSSSARRVDDSSAFLPPLPPASSPLFASPTSSYVPTTDLQSAPAVPPPPPKSIARAMPGTMTASASLPLPPPQTPQPPLPPSPQPPQPPAKQLPQTPTLHQTPSTASTTTLASTASTRPIRRRPVASSVSTASSNSSTSAVGGSGGPSATAPSPPLPAAPPTITASPSSPPPPRRDPSGLVNSITSGNLPSLPQLPELPAMPEPDAISETQSQTRTVRAPSPSPSPPPPVDPEQPVSSRVASISSILSAYSQDSSLPAGFSSSPSEGTASTNDSSYMAASASPMKQLPETKTGSGLLLGTEPMSSDLLQDEILTPLSYLLDGDYGDGEDDDDAAHVQDAEGQGNEMLASSYRSLPSQPNGVGDTPFNDADHRPVGGNTGLDPSPPPPSKTQDVLPPRSTSLGPSPATVLAKTVTTPVLPPVPGIADSAVPASTDALPSLLSAVPSPEIWKRRLEKAETNMSVTELKLASTTLSQPEPAATGAAQRSRPVTPSNGGYLAYRAPLPPPLSPLPPPPPRSASDRLHPPSPATTHAGTASSPSRTPSPRTGLPGRDIRPSRQGSPAVGPTEPASATPSVSAAPTPEAAAMGKSLSKVGIKLEATLKRKEAPLPTLPPPPPPPPPAKEVPPNGQNPALPLPPPPHQRPPTPAYDNDEHAKQQLADGDIVSFKDAPSLVATKDGGPASISAKTITVVHALSSPAASPAASPSSSPGSVPAPVPPSAPFSSDTAALVDTPRPTPPPLSVTGLVGKDIRPVRNAPQTPQTPLAPQASQALDTSLDAASQSHVQRSFAPRTSSRKGSVSTPTVPIPPLSKQASSWQSSLYEEAETVVSEAGSQVTIKAAARTAPTHYEQQQPGSSHREHENSVGSSLDLADPPLAAGMPPAFPSGYLSEIVTPDTVFAAPPPSTVQFHCLQRHRDMFRDRNANYPLSCQTCQTFERTMRWRCKWCYLRICTSCRDALHTQGEHDLARLMAFLEQGGMHQTEPMVATMASLPKNPSDGEARPYGQPMPSIAELPAIQEA